MNERYKMIISLILKYYSVNEIDILNNSMNKEKLYIVLLILNKYGLLQDQEILEEVKNKRVKLKKAEEKLLINREFRRKYYELEDVIEKIM